jgi:hypothetical protein
MIQLAKHEGSRETDPQWATIFVYDMRWKNSSPPAASLLLSALSFFHSFLNLGANRGNISKILLIRVVQARLLLNVRNTSIQTLTRLWLVMVKVWHKRRSSSTTPQKSAISNASAAAAACFAAATHPIQIQNRDVVHRRHQRALESRLSSDNLWKIVNFEAF